MIYQYSILLHQDDYFLVVYQCDSESEMISQIALLRQDGNEYHAEFFNGLFTKILEGV